MLDAHELLELQRLADSVYVDPAVIWYAVSLVFATRAPVDQGFDDLAPLIAFGASPRATLGLVAAGRALALIRGRTYVLPQDVYDVAPEVLRHRIVLSYEALADGIDADHIVDRIITAIQLPRITPGQERDPAAGRGTRPTAPAPEALPRGTRGERLGVSTHPGRRLAAGRERALRRLELDVFRRLDGLLQGDHLGLVPAPGSEAGESREYRAGDDVRRMDWPVTARTTVPHVRDTIADRELETWVVVDRSASLDFGTAQCEKRDLALAAVAAVGFLTSRGRATASAPWCSRATARSSIPALGWP